MMTAKGVCSFLYTFSSIRALLVLDAASRALSKILQKIAVRSASGSWLRTSLRISCLLYTSSMKPEERKAAYACDITYVTNNELGFDYLRDNMAIYKEQLVLRDLHYAIIDEVDSVLIDEARTPLIISGQSGKSTSLYEACDILARQLKRGDDVGEFSKMDAIMGIEQEENGDFVVNEKDKVVNLTAEGIEKVEKFFHIENLADPENLEIQNNIIPVSYTHLDVYKRQMASWLIPWFMTLCGMRSMIIIWVLLQRTSAKNGV